MKATTTAELKMACLEALIDRGRTVDETLKAVRLAGHDVRRSAVDRCLTELVDYGLVACNPKIPIMRNGYTVLVSVFFLVPADCRPTPTEDNKAAEQLIEHLKKQTEDNA